MTIKDEVVARLANSGNKIINAEALAVDLSYPASFEEYQPLPVLERLRVMRGLLCVFADIRDYGEGREGIANLVEGHRSFSDKSLWAVASFTESLVPNIGQTILVDLRLGTGKLAEQRHYARINYTGSAADGSDANSYKFTFGELSEKTTTDLEDEDVLELISMLDGCVANIYHSDFADLVKATRLGIECPIGQWRTS